MEAHTNRWHHGPTHLFAPNSLYMLTAPTLGKQHIFRGDDRLQLLQDVLFEVAEVYKWELQAWAIFSNHYHFIARAPDNATTLRRMIQRLHSQTARIVNRIDGLSRRQVWFQYWDVCLSSEKSYYAHLNYVHNNPVKHGVVEHLSDYPYCSASQFKANADNDLWYRVLAHSDELVKVEDSFSVE